MSIFTSLPARPATEAQREYLRNLMATRAVPQPGGHMGRLVYLAEHHPGWLTVSQASELISVLKDTKTAREIEQDRRKDECERTRAYMWGTLDGDLVGEDVVADRWDDVLTRHFYIQREVWGTHMTGRRLRIDRILWPRFNWSDGTDTPIGFEIKTRNGAKGGPRQVAAYGAATRWDIETPFPWGDPPEHRMLLIGLHTDHRDESRALEPFGGFGFVFEPVNIYGAEDIGTQSTADLRLYYNGTRMWSAQNGVPRTRWGARRKIGSH